MTAEGKMPDFSSGDTTDIFQILRDINDLDSTIKGLDKMIKAKKTELSNLMEEAYDLMSEESLQALNLEGKNFYRNLATYISVNKEEEDEATQWLKTEGFGPLFKETINSRTLSSSLKEKMEAEGEVIPTNLFNIKTTKRIGMRKA